MGTMTTPIPQVASNFDEVSMHQSLFFSDSLKDLKNLRSQLYSAAEYFELSYTNDDQKHTVVETLKDYAIKALVNTVDHLGSVTYKVNDLLDEKVDEVSGTEFRVSCIEQRLRTCQEYIDHEGLSQQSSVIGTPKYHKCYVLPGKYFNFHQMLLSYHFVNLVHPLEVLITINNFSYEANSCSVGETIRGANKAKSKFQGCNLDDEDEWHQFRNAVLATIRELPATRVGRGRSPSSSPQPPQRPAVFSFTSTMPKKEIDKRTVSPHRFPLVRSGSLASRPTTPSKSQSTTPNSSRPTTPNPPNARRRYPSEPQKSASMWLPAERDNNGREVEQIPSKSKRLLKALLSRRKSKKDDMLYTYLDEY